MSTFLPKAALALSLTPLALPALAANISVLLGDVDCFGEAQINCDNGFFPTLPSFDNATLLDPVGMDEFTTHGALSFTFDLMLGAATVQSASVDLRVAGVDMFVLEGVGVPPADAVEGMGFELNGAFLGDFYEPVVINSTISQRTVSELTFTVAVSDIVANGANILTLTPEDDFDLLQYEAYAVDFARLNVVTAMAPPPPTPPIPVPAGLPLLAGGLAAIYGAKRLRAAKRRG